MSQRYGIAGQQYLDDNGDPLSGGKLNFYDPGTVVRKNTYEEEAESTANANPVVLDAFGRQGDIWFTGTAKVVLTDSDDAEIDTTDPVGTASSASAFAAYNAATSYDAGDIVTATDDLVYRSIVGNNLGNTPQSSAGQWEEIRFVGAYNASVTYNADDVVESSGRTFISRVGSNLGNTPATSATQWRPLDEPLWSDGTVHTSAINPAVTGTHYLTNTNAAGFIVTLPTGVAGEKVAFSDYGGDWATNNLTLTPATGEKIMNETANETLLCNINYASITLQYDATRGWILV